MKMMFGLFFYPFYQIHEAIQELKAHWAIRPLRKTSAE